MPSQLPGEHDELAIPHGDEFTVRVTVTLPSALREAVARVRHNVDRPD